MKALRPLGRSLMSGVDHRMSSGAIRWAGVLPVGKHGQRRRAGTPAPPYRAKSVGVAAEAGLLRLSPPGELPRRAMREPRTCQPEADRKPSPRLGPTSPQRERRTQSPLRESFSRPLLDTSVMRVVPQNTMFFHLKDAHGHAKQ